ncbi:hypothetical protein BJX96DRAFT_148540 [Aspergillus floccosus]
MRLWQWWRWTGATIVLRATSSLLPRRVRPLSTTSQIRSFTRHEGPGPIDIGLIHRVRGPDLLYRTTCGILSGTDIHHLRTP